MTEIVDAGEAEEYFLNVPRKLDDTRPDLKYFQENRPVFYYAPFDQWFVFGYDDVAKLSYDPHLSAGRMNGFVDQAPPEVRNDVKKVAPYLGIWRYSYCSRTTRITRGCASSCTPRSTWTRSTG